MADGRRSRARRGRVPGPTATPPGRALSDATSGLVDFDLDVDVDLDVAAWPAWRGGEGNPYTSRLAAALTDRGVRVRDLTRRDLVAERLDIVHVHWPEFALYAGRFRGHLRGASVLVALYAAKRRGARLVWTVHNLGSHQSTPAHAWYWRAFTRLVDGWISLSDAARPVIRDRFPRLSAVPSFVIPHGHYRDSYPPPVPLPEARARLGIPARAKVWLCVGRIRPYKGIDTLVAAFSRLADPDARLVVAGDPTDAKTADGLVKAARHDGRIRLELRFVRGEEISTLVGAADVVVLPYRQILNSGSALLALSLDRPVLVSESPSTAELAAMVPGWVTTFSGALDAPTLERSWNDRPTGTPDLRRFAWGPIANQTLDAYHQIIA